NPDGTPPIPAVPATILTSQNLSTDGQYHELVYDLSSVTFLKNVWHWGLDLAAHPNNIVVNIDNIQLWNSTTPTGVPGDFNEDDKVDAADYVVWRKNDAANNPLPNDDGLATQAGRYNLWRASFGNMAMGSGAAVPEPSSAAMLLLTAMVVLWWKRRGV
ncbi:MAG: PEP-CTERM sorting domain-containing protein, partial [Planctomycetes bacterium]|nr:PEP-CTERM sorting domain-containing protein [Planctomycetota bacterium]